jgi:hypothetical protein
MSADDLVHLDDVEEFRMLRHPELPDLTILRVVTQDGRQFNFGLDREAFTHIVKVWSFDLDAIAAAIASGVTLPGKPVGSSDASAKAN